MGEREDQGVSCISGVLDCVYSMLSAPAKSF